MLYKFYTVQLVNIDGEPLKKEQPVHKLLAQMIYTQTKNLDLIEKAMQMNRGEDVELEKAEIEEVISLVKIPGGFLSFARKAILDYIELVRKDENK